VSGARISRTGRDLLRGLNGLPFRVVADHDEVTVVRRHRLRRVRRADDRERLRSERKAEQDQDEPSHIAVLLCIICAMEKIILQPKTQ